MVRAIRIEAPALFPLGVVALALGLVGCGGAERSFDASALSKPVHSHFSARVVAVLDGDTIEVVREGAVLRLRLRGVDAPEVAQAYGVAARRFTAALVSGRDVRVEIVDTDRYGRAVADVWTAGRAKSVSHALVAEGMAWWFRRYSVDRELERLENIARSDRRGLWADPDPEAPWEFRARRERAHAPVDADAGR